jgi:hypothetical protein
VPARSKTEKRGTATRWGAVALLCLGMLTALSASSSASPASPRILNDRPAGKLHRVGGHVRSAWPQSGRRPRSRLTRWLARQVGPTVSRPCAANRRAARRRCRLIGLGSAIPLASGEPGSPRGRLARVIPDSGSGELQLVRSYEIPVDDPSYKRLLNWSWTYDSAIAATAFASTKDAAESARLLDQLAALQYKDGSIEVAFNVATGDSARLIRSGTVAWVGLAAAAYDSRFGTGQFLRTEQRAADYLLSLRGESGLIRGGPDVKWVSTEHNLTAYALLSRLSEELRGRGEDKAADSYESAAAEIASGIDSRLLVADTPAPHFRQGLDDDVRALDVQTLGSIYLLSRGDADLADAVLDYATKTFPLTVRSIRRSKDPATYNMTYSAPGPFGGFRPYAGRKSPRIIWFEGTAQVRLAEAALGRDTSEVDKQMEAFASVTVPNGDAPLQSNATVDNPAYGVEFHVWPASNSAAWAILSQHPPGLFAAPMRPAG